VASKPIYMPMLRIIKRRSCESASYVIGLSLTGLGPRNRVKHNCSGQRRAVHTLRTACKAEFPVK